MRVARPLTGVCHPEDPHRGMVEVPGAINILAIDHRLVDGPSMAGTRPKVPQGAIRTPHANPILENQDIQGNMDSTLADILEVQIRLQLVSPAVHRDSLLTV